MNEQIRSLAAQMATSILVGRPKQIVRAEDALLRAGVPPEGIFQVFATIKTKILSDGDSERHEPIYEGSNGLNTWNELKLR